MTRPGQPAMAVHSKTFPLEPTTRTWKATSLRSCENTQFEEEPLDRGQCGLSNVVSQSAIAPTAGIQAAVCSKACLCRLKSRLSFPRASTLT